MTSQVAAAGSGTLHRRQRPGQHRDQHLPPDGPWSIAYQAPGLPARSLTVFDGYASINIGQGAVTGSINGFVTPPTGTVSAKVGVVAYQGDFGFTGDSMSLNGNASEATR